LYCFRAVSCTRSCCPKPAPSHPSSSALSFMRVNQYGAALIALAISNPVAQLSAQAKPFALTVPNIMRGPELYGREPSNVRWSADNQWIYFNWNPPGTKWDMPTAPYRVRATVGSKPELVTQAHVDSMAPYLAGGPSMRDGTRAVSARGDLFLVDKAGKARQLTSTTAAETNPMFSSRVLATHLHSTCPQA
jgi:hypothetical protein